MAQSALTRQANGLVTQFVKKYEEKYHRSPGLNRYREKWGFQDMVTDLGYDRAREIVDYYFKTDRAGHPVAFLLNNYDKINSFYDEKQQDAKKRKALREATAKRVREWEEKNGK